MKKIFIVSLVAACAAFFLVSGGCKGKEKPFTKEEVTDIGRETVIPVTDEAMQQMAPEPSATTVVETIPPNASPTMVPQTAKTAAEKLTREKEIQVALKNAGFYSGAIDGKIGAGTKRAVLEFQRAKGLKADGKVGPKTMGELEKYLAQ